MRISLLLAAVMMTRTLAAQTDTMAPNPRARLFVARGCADCHAIAQLKVKAKADVGPDLSAAYVDVPYRYGVTLERFFDEPEGLMRMILGVHIQLPRAEGDSLVRLFRDLYTEHLDRQDSLVRQARPVSTSPRQSEPHR
ncbi:MAG TPA: hypothetical protein VJ755_13130 [Gemmatimonadales bacterium]|nr:hypothetical protein [Gemmatimonadales bacterium]